MRMALAVCGAAGLALAAAIPGLSTAQASPAGFTVSRISVGMTALSVAADPASGQVYVGDGTDVSVIDSGTNAVTATISLGGYFALGLAVDPASGTVYVAGYDNQGSSAILVISAATDAVTDTIAEPTASLPVGIAVDPLSDTVYLTNRPFGEIMVIDGATDEITKTISLGSNGVAEGIAVDPATGTVYVDGLVAGSSTWALWAIDAATDVVSGPVDLGTTNSPSGGASVAVDAGTDTVYAANAANDLQVIDGATDTVTGTIAIAPSDVAVDPQDGTIFATSAAWGTAVADGSSDAIISSFPRGGSAAADSGNGTMYIASNGPDVWVVTPSATTAMSPIFTGGVEAVFTAGLAGSHAVQASAAPAATFSETGALPAGLSLTPDGVLAGTPGPRTGGLYDIMVTAANSIAPSITEDFFIDVGQAPAITSPPRATFRTGSFGSFDVAASGYPSPTFTETGALPAGLGLNPDGQLAGSPLAGWAGVYRITISATNGVGPPGTQTFTLTVGQAPRITSPAHATFKAGVRGTFTVTAAGFPAPRLKELFRLPAGLSFKPGPHGTAVITGTPKRSGRHAIVIVATNGASQVRKTLVITVT